MKIYTEVPEMGYRRIRDTLAGDYDIHVNDKRVYHLCRELGIRSTLKHRRYGCTRASSKPDYTAENRLNRKFVAGRPNEKWLTDVTEFKYGSGGAVHKLYLSAILDLYDRRVVAYVLGDSNNNALVFETFDKAVATDPDAHPLFHSDRGYQYTSKDFHKRLEAAGMEQSMFRVGKCIDNGPMEGFWGILKREMYYGKKYSSREALVKAIEAYMDYYTNRRIQRKLCVRTPMAYHKKYYEAA